MNFKMCGGLFSFCFLHETVFGNGQVAITHNVGAMSSSGFEKQNLKYRTNDDSRTNVKERTNTAIAYSRC